MKDMRDETSSQLVIRYESRASKAPLFNGVKVHAGKGPILALPLHNLTMIRRAKKSSVADDDIYKCGFDDRKYSVLANEAERLMLQQENLAILHNFGAIDYGDISSNSHARECPCCLHGRKQEDGEVVAKTIIIKWREQAFWSSIG